LRTVYKIQEVAVSRVRGEGRWILKNVRHIRFGVSSDPLAVKYSRLSFAAVSGTLWE